MTAVLITSFILLVSVGGRRGRRPQIGFAGHRRRRSNVRATAQRFVELAGGAESEFVLVPTAQEGDELDLKNQEAEFVRRLGLGIDEPTAVVVHGDRLEVIGRGVVGIYDGKEHDGKRQL